MAPMSNLPEPLRPSVRVRLAALAFLLLTLLATASALEPNPQGYGTHTQLGLGECFILRQWGVRCPTCGMTTAWSRLLNGNLRGAVGASAGGFLLAIASLSAIPWLLATAAIGRWCYLRPPPGLVFPLFAVWLLVVLLDWIRHTGLSLFVERILQSGQL